LLYRTPKLSLAIHIVSTTKIIFDDAFVEFSRLPLVFFSIFFLATIEKPIALAFQAEFDYVVTKLTFSPDNLNTKQNFGFFNPNFLTLGEINSHPKPQRLEI
jgi:hypothetical protein